MQISLPDSVVDRIISSAAKRPFTTLPGYMERSWLIPPTRILPFDVRIHHILRSDLDRHLHDHPWDYTTLLLRSGYTEETFDGDSKVRTKFRTYGPGSLLVRKATHYHRLVLSDVKEGTWTMFMMGKKQQTWGFWRDGAKVNWEEYLNEIQLQN